jgi:NAD(P)-dependent dehydrogenase (short-subunit alcohol dehydrogenase family)
LNINLEENQSWRLLARTAKASAIEFQRMAKRPSAILDISTAPFDDTFETNVYAMFWIIRAALPHLEPGATIINIASVNAYDPAPLQVTPNDPDETHPARDWWRTTAAQGEFGVCPGHHQGQRRVRHRLW